MGINRKYIQFLQNNNLSILSKVPSLQLSPLINSIHYNQSLFQLLQLLDNIWHSVMSRYQTLDISLQTDNKNNSRLSQTLDLQEPEEESDHQTQTDDRTKKFRELYIRNEKLRKQLKILNLKLDSKIQKIRLPNVKHRSASMNLNNPPNKALIRQLQNAYRQVTMYKKQIQILRVKEESQENYAKLRDIENMVAYKDKEIAKIQQQLISAKKIKKLQQRKILSELQDEDVKERLQKYQKEHKQLREKLKFIARRSRKRQQQYKKQQQFLVNLEKKFRAIDEEAKKQEADSDVQEFQKPNRIITERQFKVVKAEIAAQKKQNDQILKKIQISKKIIQSEKQQHAKIEENLKEKNALLKNMKTQIIAFHRLLREQERRQKQQKQQQQKQKQQRSPHDKNYSNDDSEDSDDDDDSSINIRHDGTSRGEGYNKQQGNRQWKGKYIKVEHGYGGPGDRKYQYQGDLLGFNIALDENESICGISFIFNHNGAQKQSEFLGNHSNVELKWVCDKYDQISKISGSFTDQSYLNELMITSKKGKIGAFGIPSSNPFMFILNTGQKINGCFGSMRNMGRDQKITQFGFWISRDQ